MKTILDLSSYIIDHIDTYNDYFTQLNFRNASKTVEGNIPIDYYKYSMFVDRIKASYINNIVIKHIDNVMNPYCNRCNGKIYKSKLNYTYRIKERSRSVKGYIYCNYCFQYVFISTHYDSFKYSFIYDPYDRI
jgi:hypothetical protein